MFIERATARKFLLAPKERNVSWSPAIAGNIALRWSAGLVIMAGSMNIRLLWRQSDMRHKAKPLVHSTKNLFSILILFASTTSFVGLCAAQPLRMKPNAELGRRIYREGVLPSGKPLRAIVQGDVAIAGTQLTCVNCHRRSGFGSTEGAAFVPPITGSFLFGGRELRRTDLFRKLFQEVQPNRFRARVRDPRVRAPYTDQSLTSALREGRDSSNREFDPLMPRYELSDEEAAHLVAYLKSFSTDPAPGVTRSAIHFGTIVTDKVEREKRRAILDVMDAYFRWKNSETRGLLERPGHAAFYDADSYGGLREWVLNVWELKGPEETWPRQLDAHYRKQPVFALLGGIGEENWWPVHEFCEHQELPCIFPNTNLPVVSPFGAYSLYLSGGLTVEAQALAQHLREKSGPADGGRVLQVYRDTGGGAVLAGAFHRSLREQGRANLSEYVILGSREPSPARWKKLLEDERPSTLVLWLGEADLAALQAAQVSAAGVRQIYLSYSLLNAALPPLPESFRDKTFLTFPFTLPETQTPHAYRARAWLRSRGVVRAYERIQFNTYFTLAVVDHSLMNLAGSFSRDYFVENVEHETEGTPNPGVFPSLSLGPGQRFASKGSYIVKVSNGEIEAASSWIVP